MWPQGPLWTASVYTLVQTGAHIQVVEASHNLIYVMFTEASLPGVTDVVMQEKGRGPLAGGSYIAFSLLSGADHPKLFLVGGAYVHGGDRSVEQSQSRATCATRRSQV